MTKRDKTKDLLFNAIDYLVMIVIIIGIVIILGYKFELLFNKGKTETEVAQTQETKKEVNVTSNDIKETENAEPNVDINLENSETNEEESSSNEIIISDPNKTDETENTETTTTEEKPTENTQPEATGEEVKINIPSGTLPGGMGEILANAGLVASKEDFVNKAVEMKLDRNLKSGEFVFKKGQSLEEIVRILAK